MKTTSSFREKLAYASLGGLRIVLIVSGLAILALATAIAWRQQVYADPMTPTPTWSLAWWLHPVERNALQRLPLTAPRPRDAIFLDDGVHGWVVYQDAMLATDDGGQHWRQVAAPGKQVKRGSLYFLDAKQGWVIDSGTVRATGNGGKSWFELSRLAVATEGEFGIDGGRICFSDAQHGWLLLNGVVRGSSDGGHTWVQLQAGYQGDRWQGMQMLNAKEGWLVGVAKNGAGEGLAAYTDDGGKNWRRYVVGANSELNAVYFSDKSRGWAVGWDTSKSQQVVAGPQLSPGILYTTVNGGAKWDAQKLPAAADSLVDIRMQGSRGLAAMLNGGVLQSLDGGRSWTLPAEYSRAAVVRYPTPQQGWVVFDTGEIRHSRDGGASWQPQSLEQGAPAFRELSFADKLHGWMIVDQKNVALDSVILNTSDGGGTWRQQAKPAHVSFMWSLNFVDATYGWALARMDDGSFSLLATQDGGKLWLARPIPPQLRPIDVNFSDRKHGWLGGPEYGQDGQQGRLFETDDSGIKWRTVPLPERGEALNAVRPLDRQTGWVVVDRPAMQQLFLTKDRGAHWGEFPMQAAGLDGFRTVPGGNWIFVDNTPPQVWTSNALGGGVQRWTRPGQASRLTAISAVDRGHAWYVDLFGDVYRTSDGGQSWQSSRLNLPSTVALWEQGAVLHFADAEHGWLASDGLLMASADGGANWSRRALAPKLPVELLAWRLQRNGAGFAVGDENQRFETDDGGGQWRPAGEYERYFAPWWWLAASVALLLCGSAIAIDPGTLVSASSVEDRLAPDAPITSAAQDQLGYLRIADGLAGFITNPATVPPFSISITGPWGKGKSSIMSLLRHRLEEWSFPIVWFNAWHHQKSEQILASLFAHIRDQAIPAWYTRRGIAFRLRLALMRWRQSGLLIPAALLAVFVLAWYLTDPGSLIQALDRAGLWLRDHMETALGAAKPGGAAGNGAVAVGPNEVKPEARLWSAALLAASGLLTLLAALKGVVVPLAGMLKAFDGARSQVTSSLKRLQPGSLDSSPAARYRFAKDFGEVCRAYGIRQLVVFVDDIDRCDPVVVPEVLELINFLMSSGSCFVILGAEKSWVRAAVANAYKDLAATIKQHDGGVADATHKEFAHRYLEKLLNLEVPVTASGDNVVKAMLVPNAAGDMPERSAGNLLRGLRRTWPLLLSLSLVLGAVQLGRIAGHRLHADDHDDHELELALQNAALQATALLTPPSAAKPRPQCLSSDQKCKDDLAAIQQQQKARLEEAKKTAVPSLTAAPAVPLFPLRLFLPVALLALLLGGVASLRVPRFVRSDSANFQRALEIWADWLSERHQSPRSFKRFVNRVRFLAMLERGASAQPESWWAQLQRWRQERGSQQPVVDRISPAIVAYAAILSRQHGWRCNMLEQQVPLAGAAMVRAMLAEHYTPGKLPFDTVYAELAAAMQRHMAEEGFGLDGQSACWLPPAPLCRLIEQVILCDQEPEVARVAAKMETAPARRPRFRLRLRGGVR